MIKYLQQDWELFKAHVSNTKLYQWLNRSKSGGRAVLPILVVVIVAILGRLFPIGFSIIWISIPTTLILIYLVSIKISKSVRKVMIAIVIFQSFGIYANKDEIRNFIGYNAIKGYYSHYETVIYYDDYADYEKEVQVYECDHWTGRIIIEIFNWTFIPFILSISYLTWKVAHNIR